MSDRGIDQAIKIKERQLQKLCILADLADDPGERLFYQRKIVTANQLIERMRNLTGMYVPRCEDPYETTMML